jgi:hypothetical protein
MKLEYITTLPYGTGEVVAMTTFRDEIIIATKSGEVYRLTEDGVLMQITPLKEEVK